MTSDSFLLQPMSSRHGRIMYFYWIIMMPMSLLCFFFTKLYGIFVIVTLMLSGCRFDIFYVTFLEREYPFIFSVSDKIKVYLNHLYCSKIDAFPIFHYHGEINNKSFKNPFCCTQAACNYSIIMN